LLHALEQVDSGKTTHFAVAVGKCNQGDYSWEGATSCPLGGSIEDIASGRVLLEISSALAPSNIQYLNGMLNFEVVNMRSTCLKTTSECGKYTHCNAGTNVEGIQRADLLHDSADYCNGLGVPIIVFGVGGDDGCKQLWNKLNYSKFTKVCERSGHMCTADSFCPTYKDSYNQMMQVTQKYSTTSDALRVFDMDVVCPRVTQLSLDPTPRPDPLIDIMRASDSTRYVGNPNVEAELEKAEESHRESRSKGGTIGGSNSVKSQCEKNDCTTTELMKGILEKGAANAGCSVWDLRSKGGCNARGNEYAELEKQALEGESGIHRVKCNQPIDCPIELPEGYCTEDFLTGDQTWICPYPDCKVKRGLPEEVGHPKKFDSSSSVSARRNHISKCRKKYEETHGTSAECGFERLGKPKNSNGYFGLTCPRCQEASEHPDGEHRPSAKHGSWLDLGETTEVGLPCNENLSESGSDDVEEEQNIDTDSVSENESAVFELIHIFSEKELRNSKRTKCDNCRNAASSIWENIGSGKKWTCCIDCQHA